MHTLAERNILLREQVPMPSGLNLAREAFREGWDLMPRANADGLARKMRVHGWSLQKIGEGVLRSGVGATTKEAVASALKLSLRHIGELFSAVEVTRIELTQYPWFYLARVSVNPYLIEQCAILPVADYASPRSLTEQPRRAMRKSPVRVPYFASAIPQLKEILIASRVSVAKHL